MLSTRGIPKRQLSLPLDQVTDRTIAKQQQQQQQQQNNVHPDHWIASVRFWDTLPRIHLTRRALAEHDRRNRESTLQLQTSNHTRLYRRRPTRSRPLVHEKQQESLRYSRDPRSSPEMKRFARGGGPDLTKIRGYPDPTTNNHTVLPETQPIALEPTALSKRSSPYDANYRLKLAQTGIHSTEEIDEDNRRVKPANYHEIITRLNQPRPSLSSSVFTEQDFESFQEQTEQATSESDTIRRSVAMIEGSRRHIFSRTGGPFNNLRSFNPDLAMAVPDLYDGAPPLSIDHRVLNDLNQSIIPSTDTSQPAVPNFFLEGKSSKGRADVAKLQATHNGAIGARAITSLQSYPSGVPQYDRNAYTVTSTYVDGTLKMYTTHATAPRTPDGPPSYHMTQVRAFAMTDNSRTFREGATWYRNARDLAKEERDSAIQQANQAARQVPTNKHGSRGRTRTNIGSRSA